MYAETPPPTSYIPAPPPKESPKPLKAIPAAAYITGIILFFLPFAEIKCNPGNETGATLGSVFKNDAAVLSNTGIGFVTGMEWKMQMAALDNLVSREHRDAVNNNLKKQKPNPFALAAFVLAIAGLALCFANKKSLVGLNAAVAVLAAGSLIGLMIDLKNDLGKSITDFEENGIPVLTLKFTHWFFIAIVAFLTAAVSNFLRLRKT